MKCHSVNVKPETKAYLAEQGSKVAADLVRMAMARSRKPRRAEEEVPAEQPPKSAEVPQEPAATPEGVSEEKTLQYQLDHLLSDLMGLETEHLPDQGRIYGQPCDCIAKHARKLRDHALETIPIASRQGKDPKLFSEMASAANYLMQIGTTDVVVSGRYDDEYLKQAGIISNYRKEVDRMLAELTQRPAESCPRCPELLSLAEYVKRRKAAAASPTGRTATS